MELYHNSPLDIELNLPHRSVVDRYYQRRYKTGTYLILFILITALNLICER